MYSILGVIGNIQSLVSSNANLLPDVLSTLYTVAPSQSALPTSRQPTLVTTSKAHNDGLHIEIPNHVRAIYLNGDNSNISM